ncbi:hypothetical protein [Arthrobacter zhaoguopingii]|uniref:hypothetical protein n=1 Tax=Arthrobacter zhaoguopingii TaxID=2681491 RepID=UPI00135CA543|nr:hypothetical protein [Arthrobacter zhaoguopingii]
MNGYPAKPRLKQLLSAAAVILLGVLLAGCGPAGAEGPGAHDPSAQMRPELLDISTSPANPGRTIRIRFPQETERGIAWVLEEQYGDIWHARYFLSATTGAYGGSGSPLWWSVDDGEGRGWEDIGIAGPGPDTLIIPDSIRPGKYRLCTANSMPNVCTPLDIAERRQGTG